MLKTLANTKPTTIDPDAASGLYDACVEVIRWLEDGLYTDHDDITDDAKAVRARVLDALRMARGTYSGVASG